MPWRISSPFLNSNNARCTTVDNLSMKHDGSEARSTFYLWADSFPIWCSRKKNITCSFPSNRAIGSYICTSSQSVEKSPLVIGSNSLECVATTASNPMKLISFTSLSHESMKDGWRDREPTGLAQEGESRDALCQLQSKNMKRHRCPLSKPRPSILQHISDQMNVPEDSPTTQRLGSHVRR